MTRQKLYSLLMVPLLILASCQNQPIERDWCYIYDFRTSASGINILQGSHVPGTGILTSVAGELQFNWVHSQIVTPAEIVVTAGRAAGVTGDIVARANALVFGVPIAFEQTIPAAAPQFFSLQFLPTTAGESGTVVNASFQASAQMIVQQIEIRGQGLNPFPVNFCGQFTPSPSPTSTSSIPVTNTPSATASATATMTVTPGPSPTPIPPQFYLGNAYQVGTEVFGPNSTNNILPVPREYSDRIVGAIYEYTFSASSSTNTFLALMPNSYSTGASTAPGVPVRLCFAIESSNPTFISAGTTHSAAASLMGATCTRTHNGGNHSHVNSVAVGGNVLSWAHVWGTGNKITFSRIRLIYYGYPFTPTPSPTTPPTATPIPTRTQMYIPPSTIQPTRTPLVLATTTPRPSATPIPPTQPLLAVNLFGPATSCAGINYAASHPDLTRTSGQNYTPPDAPFAGHPCPTLSQVGWLDSGAAGLNFNINNRPAGSYRLRLHLGGISGLASPLILNVNGTSQSYSIPTTPGTYAPIDLYVTLSSPGTITVSDTDGYFSFYAYALELWTAPPPPAPTSTLIPPPTLPVPATIDPGDPNPNPTGENEAEWNILDSINDFFTDVANAAQGGADFLGRVVNWANGTVNNGMTGISNIVQTIAGVANSVVRYVTDLFQAGQLTLDLTNNLFQIAGGWLGGTTTRMNGIMVAFFNTPASPIPGLPQCITNPQAHDLCAFWYMLDWTIFAPGTPGAYIVPVMTIVMNIAIVLYFVNLALQMLRKVENITRVS